MKQFDELNILTEKVVHQREFCVSRRAAFWERASVDDRGSQPGAEALRRATHQESIKELEKKKSRRWT